MTKSLDSIVGARPTDNSGPDPLGADRAGIARARREALRHTRPAIHFLGRRWTYAEVADAVERVAAGLQARGIAKGDRVGLCLPNTPFFVVAYYAALRIGAVVVNYNPLLRRA